MGCATSITGLRSQTDISMYGCFWSTVELRLSKCRLSEKVFICRFDYIRTQGEMRVSNELFKVTLYLRAQPWNGILFFGLPHGTRGCFRFNVIFMHFECVRNSVKIH